MIIALVIVTVLAILSVVGGSYLALREIRLSQRGSSTLLWRLCREQQNRITDLENRHATLHWEEYAQLQNHVLNAEDKTVLQDNQEDMRVPEAWGERAEDIEEANRIAQGAGLEGVDVFDGPTVG